MLTLVNLSPLADPDPVEGPGTTGPPYAVLVVVDFAGSYTSSVFHRRSAMAASRRARVSLARCGRVPWSNKRR